jgi:hypothetical protein
MHCYCWKLARQALLFGKRQQKTSVTSGLSHDAVTAHDPANQSFFASFCSQKDVLAFPCLKNRPIT